MNDNNVVHVRCPKPLWTKFRKLAKSQDLTPSQLMRKLIREELEK